MYYQLGKGTKIDLTLPEYALCYRGQQYPNKGKPDRDPIYFSSKQDNRFHLMNLDVESMHMSLSPMASLIEPIEIFRHITLGTKLKLGKSRLEKYQHFVFEVPLFSSLKLLDLASEGASLKHGLKRDDPILVSTNYDKSSEFAEQAYHAGYDGIIFNTRQDCRNSVVLFQSAKKIMAGFKVISHQSFWKAYPHYNIDVNVAITLIDDT